MSQSLVHLCAGSGLTYISLVPISQVSIQQFILFLLQRRFESSPASANGLGVVRSTTLIDESLSNVFLEIASFFHADNQFVVRIQLGRDFLGNSRATSREFLASEIGGVENLAGFELQATLRLSRLALFRLALGCLIKGIERLTPRVDSSSASDSRSAAASLSFASPSRLEIQSDDRHLMAVST
jgi:hypothetical protein